MKGSCFFVIVLKSEQLCMHTYVLLFVCACKRTHIKSGQDILDWLDVKFRTVMLMHLCRERKYSVGLAMQFQCWKSLTYYQAL